MINICFMGSGPFAQKVLEVLHREDVFKISSVITQPAKQVGRKRILEPTPVSNLASSLGIEVFECANSAQILDAITPNSVDFLLVCDYGVLLKQPVIDLPKIDTLNIHGSLLPKYRGASPIQQAIKNGDLTTGVCLQSMVLALDAGDVYSSMEYKIDKDMVFEEIRDQLAWLGAKLTIQSLGSIADGTLKAEAQDKSQISHCYKIDKSESVVEFESQDAVDIYNKYRAFHMWPKINFNYRNQSIIIHECALATIEKSLAAGEFLVENKRLFVGCKQGVLELKEIQLPSKAKMKMADFLNGRANYFHS